MYIDYNPTRAVNHYVYTNVGGVGDQFLIRAAIDEAEAITGGLLGNVDHSRLESLESCRIWSCGSGRLAWCYYYGTSAGRSVGRKGIVYCVVFTFGRSLLKRQPRLFESFLDVVRRSHELDPELHGHSGSIERLVECLNQPTDPVNRRFIFDAIRLIHLRLSAWSAELKSGLTLSERLFARASFWRRGLATRGPERLIVVGDSAGGYGSGSPVELFNEVAGRLVGGAFGGERAVGVSAEFGTDQVVEFFELPLGLFEKPRIEWDEHSGAVVIIAPLRR